MNNEQKIMSVVVGLLQELEKGIPLNSTLPNEMLNLACFLSANRGKRLNDRTKNYTTDSTKVDSSKSEIAKLSRKLIDQIGIGIDK